jgi:hypothetical protein
MADSRVTSYLRENLAKGYRIDQLRAALAASGYSSDDITDAEREVTQGVKPAPAAAPAPSPSPTPTYAAPAAASYAYGASVGSEFSGIERVVKEVFGRPSSVLPALVVIVIALLIGIVLVFGMTSSFGFSKSQQKLDTMVTGALLLSQGIISVPIGIAAPSFYYGYGMTSTMEDLMSKVGGIGDRLVPGLIGISGAHALFGGGLNMLTAEYGMDELRGTGAVLAILSFLMGVFGVMAVMAIIRGLRTGSVGFGSLFSVMSGSTLLFAAGFVIIVWLLSEAGTGTGVLLSLVVGVPLSLCIPFLAAGDGIVSAAKNAFEKIKANPALLVSLLFFIYGSIFLASVLINGIIAPLATGGLSNSGAMVNAIVSFVFTCLITVVAITFQGAYLKTVLD